MFRSPIIAEWKMRRVKAHPGEMLREEFLRAVYAAEIRQDRKLPYADAFAFDLARIEFLPAK